MKFPVRRDVFILLVIAAVLTGGAALTLRISEFFYSNEYSALKNSQTVAVSANNVPLVQLAPLPPQKLSNPPEIIKAVYVTGYSAGTKEYLDYLSNLFEKTEINAVVVDIKDYSGLVSYNSGALVAKKYNLYNNAISDVDALVRFFHDKNIYVIGRISVFEDPAYSKVRPELAVYDKAKADLAASSTQPYLPQSILWLDNNGLSWLDPASKDAWDYNISLAKDAFLHGFDEINFDYVRFPSDGDMENMGFPVWDGKILKSDIIKNFFQYVKANLAGDPPSPGSPASAWRGKISVDLFGQTTTNTDDMGIGQVIEDAFESFDYVSPMVYPSHYVNGFMGFENPAEYPYEIVKYSMYAALSRKNTYADFLLVMSDAGSSLQEIIEVQVPQKKLSKLRPWLQDFDMGADYNADMVKAEIEATQDALGSDFNGFMLWNPSNIYTTGAILKPN